jgi:hypothetical protein
MEFDHVEPDQHALPGILPGADAGDPEVHPFSLKLSEARTICRGQPVAASLCGSAGLLTCGEPKSGIIWFEP